MPSSLDIDALSGPFVSHSNLQGTLWCQAEMRMGLMYQPCKAVPVSVRLLEHMCCYVLSKMRSTKLVSPLKPSFISSI